MKSRFSTNCKHQFDFKDKKIAKPISNVQFIHMNGTCRINSNTSTVIKHNFFFLYNIFLKTEYMYMYFNKLHYTGFFVLEIKTTTIKAENKFMVTYNHTDSYS